MTWQELFERAASFETTCDEVRNALEQRRRHHPSEQRRTEDR